MRTDSKPVSDLSSVHRFFPETHWSVVLSAGGVGSPKVEQALETLCSWYWYPLYAFARKQGNAPPEAEDLTQSFFAFFLEKNSVSKASQEKGRFRSFLLASFKNFMSRERERDLAQKRGGGYAFLSWDKLSAEDAFCVEPANNSTPETVYERAWALMLLKRALTRMDGEYRKRGEHRTFEHLRIFLQGEIPAVSCAELGQRLGKTESATKVAIYRLRKRYGEFLMEEIAHTVAKVEEIQEELRHLRRVLST